GIRDFHVTGVQTCALPICAEIQTALESNVMLEAVEDELVVETDTLDDVSDVEWEGPDYTLDWSSEPGGSGGADPAEWQQAVPEGDRKSVVEGKRVVREEGR